MRFGGIVLTALLVLGACTSDPQPKEPKPSATTATPTASPPSMPAQAKEDSPEGAAAFVKHYINVFNYASSTGDVEELSRLSSPECEGCQSYIKLYRDTYAAGGYFRGSDWKLDDLKVDFGGDESYVDTHVTAPTGTYRKSAADPEESGNEEDADIAFAVSRSGSKWSLTQLGLGEAK